jgi:hypothetical protein
MRVLQRKTEEQDEQNASGDGGDEFHQQVPMGKTAKAQCRIFETIFLGRPTRPLCACGVIIRGLPEWHRPRNASLHLLTQIRGQSTFPGKVIEAILRRSESILAATYGHAVVVTWTEMPPVH